MANTFEQALAWLGNTLGPASAEAATSNPYAAQQAQDRADALERQRAEQNRLAQERLKLSQDSAANKATADAAKATARTDAMKMLGIGQAPGQAQGDVQAPERAGQLLGGGPGAPISYGRDPNSGRMTYNNYGWVNSPDGQDTNALPGSHAGDVASRYSSPLVVDQVTKAKDLLGARPQQAQPGGGTGASDEDHARHAQLMVIGKEAGLSAGAAERNANRQVPSVLAAEKADKAAEKKTVLDAKTTAQRNTRLLATMGTRYNKQTGQTAAEEFGDNAPDMDVLQKDYVNLATQTQRDQLTGVNKLDNMISEYENVLQILPDKANASVPVNAARLKAGEFFGSTDSKALTALNARMSELATSLGGDKRVSNLEIVQLLNAGVGKFDSKESGQIAINNLKRLRDVGVKTLPIPGLHNRYPDVVRGAAPGNGGWSIRPSGQ